MSARPALVVAQSPAPFVFIVEGPSVTTTVVFNGPSAKTAFYALLRRQAVRR